MNNAFDADHYSKHKNHPGKGLDRDMTVEQAEAIYQKYQKEQNKRLYELEVSSLLSLI